MNYSERTHSLVNISKHLHGIKIPSEIADNVRLLKNNDGEDYQLIVMDKLDNDPLYFDFKKQLIKKAIRPVVKWVGREELAEISSAFDITVSSSSDSQSDTQTKVISIIKHAVDQRASDIHFRIDTTFFQGGIPS